jgi:hypothetical protein
MKKALRKIKAKLNHSKEQPLNSNSPAKPTSPVGTEAGPAVNSGRPAATKVAKKWERADRRVEGSLSHGLFILHPSPELPFRDALPSVE